MSVIQQIFKEYCSIPQGHSDISEHLPALYFFAKQCKTITELGVRQAISSYAFASARPEKYTCIDIKEYSGFTALIQRCKDEGINIIPQIADSRTVELEPTDLLFIDTLHTYAQLTIELNKHHSKVNKYIILHDTVTYSFTDDYIDYGTDPNLQSEGHTGLIPAIFNFLDSNRDWKHLKTYPNNNGLTVLTRLNHF
jgi:hypothetical protein